MLIFRQYCASCSLHATLVALSDVLNRSTPRWHVTAVRVAGWSGRARGRRGTFRPLAPATRARPVGENE